MRPPPVPLKGEADILEKQKQEQRSGVQNYAYRRSKKFLRALAAKKIGRITGQIWGV